MPVDDGGPAHLGKVDRTAVVVLMVQAGMYIAKALGPRDHPIRP